jgi:hypothetical protein
MSKTPLGLFTELYIDNDLQAVRDKMHAYFNEDGETE